ncbi:MAG: hypothetical protein ACYC1G_14150 [Thiobacillus sp.]
MALTAGRQPTNWVGGFRVQFLIDWACQAHDTSRSANEFHVLCAMRSTVVKSRLLPAFLSVWLGLYFCAPAQASDHHGKNGSVILRMCKSADQVKTLSVMCHSYLDGYIDAAHHYGKGKAAFCLDARDRNVAPGVLVAWIASRILDPAGRRSDAAGAGEAFSVQG